MWSNSVRISTRKIFRRTLIQMLIRLLEKFWD